MNYIKKIIIIILFASPAIAQEIGLSYSKLWSDDFQLKNPSGYGIHIYMPFKKVALKAEYNYASGETRYFGGLGPGFLLYPDDMPIEENIDSKSVIKSYDISLWVSDLIGFINPFQLNLGAGLSLNHLDGNRKGLVSGEESSFKSSDRWGFELDISLSYPRILNLPVKLEALYRLKSLPSPGPMATDSENVFQDAIGIKQLTFGISFMF